MRGSLTKMRPAKQKAISRRSMKKVKAKRARRRGSVVAERGALGAGASGDRCCGAAVPAASELSEGAESSGTPARHHARRMAKSAIGQRKLIQRGMGQERGS